MSDRCDILTSERSAGRIIIIPTKRSQPDFLGKYNHLEGIDRLGKRLSLVLALLLERLAHVALYKYSLLGYALIQIWKEGRALRKNQLQVHYVLKSRLFFLVANNRSE
jgi:hypothetical protein